jgi:DNA repair protein SbcD/Mre11
VRLLHTSDWHLGHQLHGVARDREHAAFLAWLVEVCARERVDAVLITGDVFDGSNPPAVAQAAYYGFLAACAARGTQVIVLGGNHDSAARLEAPAPLLESLHVRVIGALPRAFADPTRIDWERAIVRLDGAVVLAVPFLRVGDLAAARVEDPDLAIRTIYKDGVEAARAQMRSGDALVVTGHLHVSGAEPSVLSERRIVVGGSEAVAGDLFPSDAAYVALGHLHKAQRIGGRDHVRYAGSPIPLSMGEAGYRHQVVIVDLDGGAALVRALEIPRTVELVKIGPAPIEQVIAELTRLPDLSEDDVHELRPYLEVHVRLDRPAPALRTQVEQALDGKRPRLVKIGVERAGDLQALGDAAAGVALADLAPRDVLVRRWRRDHEGEPPAALLAAFDALVAQVEESA